MVTETGFGEEITKKKKKPVKKWIIGLILLAILATGGYYYYNMYWRPDNFLRQIYLVPQDAIYIIETDDPVNNWKKFSQSEPWQYIKDQKKMEAIEKMAYSLDSTLRENNTLLDLLGKRNLMISAHITRKSDYDFLYIVDMQKASKMESLKSQMEIVFKSKDFKVTNREFQGQQIYELFNPIDRSTLYLSFISNHLVCSYTGLLLEKSIQEKDNPIIGRDLYFLDVEQKISGYGLCKIYLNYHYLNNYMTLLSGVSDSNMRDICQSLSYTGLRFDADNKMLSLKGYSNLSESTEDSYLPALMHSGKNRITSQKVLSNRTAFYLSMGFDDPVKFMENVETVLQKDQEAYNSFIKNRDFIENKLKINIKENFLSWMEGEVAFAQNTPGTLGRQNEFVAVIKMKDKDNALKNLNIIEENIRKHTPVKFKTLEYEGYEVHYLEMKGFFRLLFGKMFDKLNKPYYTVIDDYAVFSNSTATLLSVIEDYRNGQTLDKDTDFNRILDEFNKKSSVFAYTNARKFFPLTRDFVSPSTWKDIQDNQNFVLCFPQTAFQLTGEDNMFDTRWIAEFQTPAKDEDNPDEDNDPVDFAEREDTIQNLERFYLEKLQGNVYTEFYDNGAIKSKTEMEDGIKDGKYKAFYPDGKLQINGKFKNNRKTGTWRYYNQEGELTKKEKWKDGQLL